MYLDNIEQMCETNTSSKSTRQLETANQIFFLFRGVNAASRSFGLYEYFVGRGYLQLCSSPPGVLLWR